MRWAITPRGVAQPVGFRALGDNDPLLPGEAFVSLVDPSALVLAEDGKSLRPVTAADTLAAAKVARLTALRAQRDSIIYGVVVWDGMNISSAVEDRANLNEAISNWTIARQLTPDEQATLGYPIPQTIPWRTVEGAPLDLTYLQAVQLASALSIQKQIQFQTMWQLEAAVNAAPDLATVNAITWPA